LSHAHLLLLLLLRGLAGEVLALACLCWGGVRATPGAGLM
jgi:hypothetical protein